MKTLFFKHCTFVLYFVHVCISKKATEGEKLKMARLTHLSNKIFCYCIW